MNGDFDRKSNEGVSGKFLAGLQREEFDLLMRYKYTLIITANIFRSRLSPGLRKCSERGRRSTAQTNGCGSGPAGGPMLHRGMAQLSVAQWGHDDGFHRKSVAGVENYRSRLRREGRHPRHDRWSCRGKAITSSRRLVARASAYVR